MLIYALGRGLDSYDRKTVRAIAEKMAKDEYRFSSLVSGDRAKRAVPNASMTVGSTPMIITRKHLSRRTFLRGAGAVIGLPLLDAMVPALGWADGTARRRTASRLCFVYVPNGMVMANWTPTATGRRLRVHADPQAAGTVPRADAGPVRLDGHNANALGDGPGDHARASASFLTGAHPRESGSDIYAGISADQVAAQAIGNQTRASLAGTGPGRHRMVGLCDSKYSCAYTSSISWRTPTTPLPPLTNPRQVFERLFGNVDPNLDRGHRRPPRPLSPKHPRRRRRGDPAA